MSSSSAKGNCTVIFLDVSKAFDNIGHDHIRKCLETLPFSQRQRDLIMLLVSDNSVQIEVNRQKTKKITVKRGVPQGAPLSPSLFNMAIDFILKEVTEEMVAKAHGFELMAGEKPLSGLGFADDTVVIGKSKESALALAQIVIDGLREIGLCVNCKKSKAIVIENGHLQPQAVIQTANGDIISTLQVQERVKYLGINFEDEIVLDKASVIKSINENLDLLVATPLLKPSQKHNIINQFIWPSVVYPLQSAPLKNLTKEFLRDIDVGIRGAVKQILMIPMDSPDAMLYAPRRLRGLGIVCASWEAFLQHFSICCKMEKINDSMLEYCRDFAKEKEECLKLLDIQQESTASNTHSSQQLRAMLRLNKFVVWGSLPSKGLGVQQFSEYPKANSWMITGEGLTSSQWTSAIKMNANCCSTRGTKGRFAGSDSCRYPNCMKKETLCHVLQDCPHGADMVTARHNRVVNIIDQSLRNTGFEVYKEVHCTDGNGNRRADLVVLDRGCKCTIKSRGYILDPSIRFEKNCDQALEVHNEKCALYDPTHPYFREVYPEIEEWETIGLYIGSRGTITKFFMENLVIRFGLPRAIIKDIVRSVLSDSISLLNFHLFSSNLH